MIGISDFATNYLRTRTAERMEDACRIYKQGKITVSPDFTAGRTEETVKYEGPCRVWEVTAGNQVVISDQQVVVSQTYLSLPFDAPVPESDDIVLITSAADPDLIGRTLAIISVVRGGGLRASRKFTVRVIDSPEGKLVTSAATADLTKLVMDLRQAHQRISDVSENILDDTAERVMELQIQFAPVLTGRLRNSITIIKTKGKRVIGPQGVDYAGYQEFGTGIRGEFPTSEYEIRPKNPGGKLHFTIDGKHIQASVVHHPGIPPHPFVRPSAKKAVEELDKTYLDAGVSLIMEGKYAAPRIVKPLERGPLTDHILATIEAEELWIGDAVPPDDGGWDSSPDNAGSRYQAYGVLVPATAGDTTGPVGDTHADLSLPYVINGYGLSRKHVESYMDHVRKVLVAMGRTMVVCGESSWRIQQVRVSSIGGVARNDTVEPSEYSETDVYVLYLSKEL